jgi:hypothetical protein
MELVPVLMGEYVFPTPRPGLSPSHCLLAARGLFKSGGLERFLCALGADFGDTGPNHCNTRGENHQDKGKGLEADELAVRRIASLVFLRNSDVSGIAGRPGVSFGIDHEVEADNETQEKDEQTADDEPTASLRSHKSYHPRMALEPVWFRGT